MDKGVDAYVHALYTNVAFISPKLNTKIQFRLWKIMHIHVSTHEPVYPSSYASITSFDSTL